ncbi:hypothetical protein [Thiocapsa marina]|uniref:Uncharacterized protein n=1 Tax=Thiocapsa marina 5811 TaxID=768671 RepID=F9UCU6_9GAMM|nr:hypothetical protein [Thiocapsa marina]EGV18209.1 hypothetical protein ThimaDRAFT_2748 [Thiocapsa marina 5811]
MTPNNPMSAADVAPPANHVGRLILAPRDAEVTPDRERLLGILSDAGFIADRIPGRECAYRIGPEFSALIAFVGCAVAIASEPRTGSPFCHVVVPSVSAYPRWFQGRNTRAPRCPGCRARLSDWPLRVEQFEQSARTHGLDRQDSAVICPVCGESRPIWSWDWKQQGGFARLLIQVEEIFPGEAVPTDAFLEQLERYSGCAWRYFYVQD